MQNSKTRPIETEQKTLNQLPKSEVYSFPKFNLHKSASDLEIGSALVKLNEQDPKIRANTARLIGDLAFMKKHKFCEVVDTLNNLLINDPDSSVREEAAWALWKIGDLRAKDSLRYALCKDKAIGVKEKVARALGLLGIKEAGKDMISMLSMGKANPARLRAGLTAGLGMLEQNKAFPILLKSTQDTEPLVRNEAIKALGRFLNSSSPKLFKPALKLIIKALNFRQEKDQTVRQSAIKALRLFHNPKTIKMITNVVIKDPDSSTRHIATESLMCFEGAEVERTLLLALEDSNWEVRKSAGRILAEFVKRSQIHNMPKVREAITRMERMFPSGSREWRLASQAFMNL